MEDKYSEYTTILDKQKVALSVNDTAGIPPVMHNETMTCQKKYETQGKKSITITVALLICICVLSSIIGGSLCFGGNVLYNRLNNDEHYTVTYPPDNGENTQQSTQTNTDIKTNNGENSDITINADSVVAPATAVAVKVLPSIVGIRVTTKISSGRYGTYETSGEGSGVIYTTDGYIITNYHVVEMMVTSSGERNPNSSMEVYLCQDTEQAYEATLIGYDISSDLAVIKIEQDNLCAVELGDSDEILVGDIAIALGNPGGLEFMGSVSQGIISGLNRVITVEETYENITLIQTDAAINPGNSGGALVNSEGKLIGINSVKIVKDGYEGMGFALPVNDVVDICNDIIKDGNTNAAYLGLEFNTSYTPEYLEAYGYPVGLVISSVAQGSPAETAGFETEDILTSFGGAKIESTTDLINEKAKYKSGDTVVITVYRLTLVGSGWNRQWVGNYIDLTVTLG